MADDKSFFGPILRGELDVVRSMIAEGIPINDPKGAGHTLPLAYAIDRGQTEIAKLFVESGADLNDTRTQFEKAPLHLAADKGRIEILRTLLRAGADVRTADKNGWTPLDAAACHDGGKAGLMVAELIQRGADVHRVSKTWDTPLIKASWMGHLSAINELLKNGADPNIMGAFGTPLIRAVEKKRVDAVIALRLGGADPNRRYVAPEKDGRAWDFDGMTPLEYAKARKQKKLIPLLEATLEELKILATPPPLTAADVPALWKRIEKSANKVDKSIKKSLNRAAADADLQAVEKTCGISLPADFLASCAIHDGQKPGADESLVPEDWFDGPYELLPAAAIVSEWNMWKSLVDGGEFRNQSSAPDDGIRDAWWHPGWIPIAGNGGGDFLCLDLAPVDKGRIGQVIELRHDSPARRMGAASFAEFLREVAERWENRAAD
jgi:cell wall assembly regulator SMI1/ankyrin repeat protein